TVADFTRELSLENSITVKTSDDVDVDALKDKYVFVENDGEQNGVYRICGAEKIDGGIKLDIGSVSVIRKYRDSSDTSLGFVYNIAKGQRISIPLSNVNDGSPVFDAINDNLATAAGSTITIALNAECEDGSAITYDGTLLPRGASIDEATGKITWKPTSAQTGKNHFAITARDENGRETATHFIVTVYGSTSGSGSGGGGGAAPAPSTPSKPAEDDKKEDKEETPVTPVVPSEPSTPSVDENVRFVDLGAHAWAADSINALADEGIIKGTSENTFSPAANITRADFALLLVRAFKLTSENTENFADVAVSDYFAPELAIARNTGIVNGIGDNKYAPRNTITRQDMMTIVYRALNGLPLDGKVAPEATDEVSYPDFASVADYAKDAVSALISAELVNGKSGKIAPTDYTTRAEVAVLIKRILDYIAK
ncbi:MAG: S-layer homology domain-containing protein, partial [Oscillospiraceae bacterium]|nr:S-layer homology domain-containing protein [Oscillospiraceae bacterium]